MGKDKILVKAHAEADVECRMSGINSAVCDVRVVDGEGKKTTCSVGVSVDRHGVNFQLKDDCVGDNNFARQAIQTAQRKIGKKL